MRTRLLPVILAVFVCVIHSVHSEVSFSWVGLITSNPQDGIVACGSPIQMTIDDDFIVYGLETNEFLADEGEPTYQWYLNGSDTPCKTGQTVTFTTGDSGADVQAGDFTVSVSGSRTYTIGWPEEQLVEGCSCGCEDPFCECAFGHPIAGAKVNARGCKCCNEKTGTGEESKDAKRQGNDRLIIIPFYHYEGLDAIIANLAERAFLAAQVVITRQGETNVGNPIPIVKVGEGVELNASFKNSAVYPDFFDWTLSGVYFKDFIESAVSTPLVRHLHTDYHRDFISFYWSYYSGDNGSTIAPVYCTLSIGSHNITGIRSFEILRPNISCYATIGNKHIIGLVNNSILSLVFYTPSLNYGIKFEYTPPAPNSSFSGDSFCWTQMINGALAIQEPKGVYETHTNALDSGFIYNDKPFEAIDSPSIPLGNYQSVYQNLNATMYLMYKPSGANAAWVPLKKVDWSCACRAQYTNNKWVIDEDTRTQNVSSFSDIYYHPEWDYIRY